jgi:hypothetical protein
LLLGVGMNFLPHYENYFLNKYSVPAYAHFAAQHEYKFRQVAGLSVKTLIVYKPSLYKPPLANSINRVDMFHANLIINYYWH